MNHKKIFIVSLFITFQYIIGGIYLAQEAKTRHWSLLAQLYEEIQTYHHTIQSKVFVPYNKEAIVNFSETTINNENTITYVAKENHSAIGHVLLFKINLEGYQIVCR